jgi:hypothetical protein
MNFGVQKESFQEKNNGLDPPFLRHDREAQPTHGYGPRSTVPYKRGGRRRFGANISIIDENHPDIPSPDQRKTPASI